LWAEAARIYEELGIGSVAVRCRLAAACADVLGADDAAARSDAKQQLTDQLGARWRAFCKAEGTYVYRLACWKEYMLPALGFRALLYLP
jgi:hypothetical protein